MDVFQLVLLQRVLSLQYFQYFKKIPKLEKFGLLVQLQWLWDSFYVEKY